MEFTFKLKRPAALLHSRNCHSFDPVMSGLTLKETRLPPGFRFHLRDDELVCDYLEMKIHPRGGDSVRSFASSSNMMIDVNLNHCEPWDLPEWTGFEVLDVTLSLIGDQNSRLYSPHSKSLKT